MADVDCAGYVGSGVTLGDGAVLSLGGFDLIGDPSQPDSDGVVCLESCRVEGPGEIRAFSRDGVRAEGTASLSAVDFRAQGSVGATASSVIAKDCGFYDNTHGGIDGEELAQADNCIFTGNGTAIYSRDEGFPEVYNARTVVRDCTITGNRGSGVGSLMTVTVDNSVISGNVYEGVYGTKVTVSSSEITDNGGTGIEARGMPDPSITVRDSTISRNGSYGIRTEWVNMSDGLALPYGTARVSNSEISDNGGSGVSAWKSARISGCVIDRNLGDGVYSTKVRVSLSSVSSNTSHGIKSFPFPTRRFRPVSSAVKVAESIVVDNGCDGVRGGHGGSFGNPSSVGVRGSTVTGNALSPAFEPGVCDADITNEGRPVVVDTECGTSHSDILGTDWDECSLDPL